MHVVLLAHITKGTGLKSVSQKVSLSPFYCSSGEISLRKAKFSSLRQQIIQFLIKSDFSLSCIVKRADNQNNAVGEKDIDVGPSKNDTESKKTILNNILVAFKGCEHYSLWYITHYVYIVLCIHHIYIFQ